MQTTASVPADQFPDLLNRLPAGLDLDRLALETKAIQRKRKIGDGASLLRLALARGVALRLTPRYSNVFFQGFVHLNLRQKFDDRNTNARLRSQRSQTISPTVRLSFPRPHGLKPMAIRF
jgi:hypothetical protein